jgi:hypothetical protein
MNSPSDTNIAGTQAQREPANAMRGKRSLPPQSRFQLVAWILLLLLGVFFLFAALSDLAADARAGLPSDHLEAFHTLAGMTWATAQQTSPAITHFVTLLEVTYAVHELVFGLLFLLIVAIPFRRRARWAWWACWIPMLANLTYTFAIAHASSTTLLYSLIADIALPILLLVHIPAFFGRASQEHLSTSAPAES